MISIYAEKSSGPWRVSVTEELPSVIGCPEGIDPRTLLDGSLALIVGVAVWSGPDLQTLRELLVEHSREAPTARLVIWPFNLAEGFIGWLDELGLRSDTVVRAGGVIKSDTVTTTPLFVVTGDTSPSLWAGRAQMMQAVAELRQRVTASFETGRPPCGT